MSNGVKVVGGRSGEQEAKKRLFSEGEAKRCLTEK